jgi:FixJ family two-component response regulator
VSASVATVFVIDDDAPVRASLKRLFELENYRVLVFSCAEDFLALTDRKRPACVISDIRMPGLSGLELQEACEQKGIRIPLIFITGHGDIPMSVRAIKKGAVDFLQKPYNADTLLQVVVQAIQKDQSDDKENRRRLAVKRRWESLTTREREVLAGVVAGRLNKQIASRLGVDEKTIKFHRAHVMQKMKATSVADLVRLAEAIPIKS